MDGQPPKQWGMTPPISLALPTEHEIKLNDTLVAELRRQNNFESPEETQKRTTILGTLRDAAIEFVRQVGRKKGLSQTVIDEAGGKVMTFGSFRMGVHGPGSDIDACIVAPRHVSKDDFFDTFPGVLEKMSPAGAVEEMKLVREAYMPIIKLEYSGISIDLIFARVAISSVPANLNLLDKDLLRGLDEVEVRSLNGPRVTDETLSLVPEVKSFRLATRAIKLWAKRRGVYSNAIGFPGGIAWALMVARICQLYPHATGASIVSKFFHLVGGWPWPQPIQLKKIEEGPMQLRVWNPMLYPSDQNHLMPVITPAYPSMCSTHNISNSTKQVVVRELKRANNITNTIVNGKGEWKDLFQRHTFFTSGYKYYLSIVSGSRNKDAQSLWAGTVESKIRRLVLGIESSRAQIQLAHPYIEGFSRVHRCKSEEQIDSVLQGSLDFQAKDVKTVTTEEQKDATHAVAADGNADGLEMPKANGQSSSPKKENEEATIYTTTFYVGIELTPDAKSLDISFPVNEFKRQCHEWPQYDPDVNSLRVVHIRNYDLPDDVFVPGDVRPEAKKKKSAKAHDQSSKKRSFADSNLEVTNGDAKRRPSATSTPTLSNSG